MPAGRYANPPICDEDNLRAWSAALRRPGVSCRVARSMTRSRDAGQDDFVYLDPPYAPLSATAQVHLVYRRAASIARQQERLQQTVIALASARRLGPAQQFGVRRNPRALRGRGAAAHVPGSRPPPCRAPRHQFQGASRGPVANTSLPTWRPARRTAGCDDSTSARTGAPRGVTL